MGTLQEIPKNVEAEAAVLGAIFTKSEVLANVAEVLQPDDFYRGSNRMIYNAMRKLAADGRPIDLLTVCDALGGDLAKVGGVAYVTSIANATPTAANVQYHAGIVIECSKRRRLLGVLQEAIEEAQDTSGSVDDILEAAQKSITDIILRSSRADITTTMELCLGVSEWIDSRAAMGENTGILSGFNAIDSITHGWQPGELIVLAARPSMGKTALALNMAANACEEGKAVLFFSLEMSKEQLMARMIASERAINTQTIMNPGTMSEAEYSRMLAGLGKISQEWKFYIDEQRNITPMRISAKGRRHKARFGLDIILVDYLQLMTADDGQSKHHSAENRTQEIGTITRGLKKLAGELGVPVIVLSQLSRSVEARQDKRPLLSDLRDSGSIEQDADVVAFLYRDEYYNKNTSKDYSEFIIAKNRNGALGEAKLSFIRQFTKFMSYTKVR